MSAWAREERIIRVTWNVFTISVANLVLIALTAILR